MEQEERIPVDADWDSRILCSDGRCTGVIGLGGRCGECGMSYEGGSGAAAAPVVPEPGIPAAAGTGAAEPLTAAAEEADPDWDNRVLCSDGNCIGVIGPDGRCKECGLPRREG